MIAVLGILMAFNGAHAEWTAADKRCAAGVYCADQMICVSKVADPKPRGMHSDYYVHVVTARVFKATKNLGGGRKGLVDSMVMNADPSGNTPNITLEQAKADRDYDSGNYGAPAKITGKRVRISWGSASNYSKGINLKIVNSEDKGTYRLDKLTGSEIVEGDVVGGYKTTFECEAIVVDAPTRIDDLTRP